MTSRAKILANHKNSQRSTGPRDATRTRFNALRHGILSKEAVVSSIACTEEAEIYEEVSEALYESLAPEGAMEELLVEDLVALTLRRRRLLKYETAATLGEVEGAVNRWEQREKEISDSLPNYDGIEPWKSLSKLDYVVKSALKELGALEQEDPLAVLDTIMIRVFQVAEEKFDVPISKLLQLDQSWDNYREFPRGDVDEVVSEACRRGGVTEGEFWAGVRDDIDQGAKRASQQLEVRRAKLQRQGVLATLPPEEVMSKVVRYEAHLSRLYYKAIHELQRLQAARLSQEPIAPLAVDVSIDHGELPDE